MRCGSAYLLSLYTRIKFIFRYDSDSDQKPSTSNGTKRKAAASRAAKKVSQTVSKNKKPAKSTKAKKRQKTKHEEEEHPDVTAGLKIRARPLEISVAVDPYKGSHMIMIVNILLDERTVCRAL